MTEVAETAAPVIERANRPERLEEIIDASLELHGNRPCYWWNGKWHDCGDFLRTADDCTKALQRSGFGYGQRLVSMLPNGPMTLALALSVWRLGGTFCPLNEKAGEAYLTKTLSLLRPYTVVASDSVTNSLIDTVKTTGYTCSVMSQDIEAIPEFSGTETEQEPDLAVIFSTSGTTGEPKAVPLTHANLIDQCYEILEAIPSINVNDRLLNVLPNFHAFGFSIGNLLPLFIGASEIILPGFMPPQNTLRTILEVRPTIITLVPTMLGFLVSLMERGGYKSDSVRLLVTGGDRYNSKMEPRVKAAFGTSVVEGYGITECSPVLAVNRIEAGTRLGTVGEALSKFDLQLRTEAGEIITTVLAPDTTQEQVQNAQEQEIQEGVLWVRGPSVTSGYYHAPEINAQRFDNGWFNTGDFVRLEGRYISILDRVTDIIIVSGFNVYPQEVEAVLSEHPAVQTAVVVGTPNTISGEVPKAFIIKHDTPEAAAITGSDIIRFCKNQLSHYKVPRDVEFVTELPLSPAGKVLRRVLRERERQRQAQA